LINIASIAPNRQFELYWLEVAYEANLAVYIHDDDEDDDD
jgi:hypothetical protein